GPLPLSSVCAYDTRFLPEQLRRGIAQTHPALLTAHGRTPNDLYEDPATVLRRTSPHGADPVEVTAPTLHPAALTEVTQLADLRTQLRGVLDPLRQHLQLCEDFFTAVVEVATNGLRHGRPPLDVRLWITRDRLVCTVTDRGVGFDDPLAGYRPYGAEPLHGMGLWLVRQACDRIDAYRTPGGFTVRLVTGLPRGPGDPGNAAGTAP
ncbi:MAG: ATP-binding protein, partial [Actinomycetes bacterium]